MGGSGASFKDAHNGGGGGGFRGGGGGRGSGRCMGTRSQCGGRTDQDLEVSELPVSDLLLKDPSDENPAAHQWLGTGNMALCDVTKGSDHSTIPPPRTQQ